MSDNLQEFNLVSFFAAMGASKEALADLEYYVQEEELIQQHLVIQALDVYRKPGWAGYRFDAVIAIKGDLKRKFTISGWLKERGLFAQFTGFDKGAKGYYIKQDKNYNPILKDGQKQADFKRPLIAGPVEVLNPEIEKLYGLKKEDIPALGMQMGDTGNIRIRSKLQQGYSIIAWKQAGGNYTFTADSKVPFKIRRNIEEFIKYQINAIRWADLKVTTRRAKPKHVPNGVTKTDVKHPKRGTVAPRAEDDNGAGIPMTNAKAIAKKARK